MSGQYVGYSTALLFTLSLDVLLEPIKCVNSCAGPAELEGVEQGNLFVLNHF